MTEPIEADPAWQHVTHCSECYREFLGFQTASRRQRRIRRESIRWGIAVGALVLAFCSAVCKARVRVRIKAPPECRTVVHSPNDRHRVDDTLSFRGRRKEAFLSDSRPGRPNNSVAGRKQAGQHEFQLRSPADQVVLTKSAMAKINQGVTSFQVNADLTRLQPGQYKMEVRQVPYDWEYYPVVVR
jgi:hypothetical protein